MDKVEDFLRGVVSEVWGTLGTVKQKPAISNLERLKQYEVVVAFPTVRNLDRLEFIGYPVQVRKRTGIFESDTVLMRGFDGSLSTWECQAFLPLNDDHREAVTRIFSQMIEEDIKNEDEGFTIMSKNLKFGYIVEEAETASAQED